MDFKTCFQETQEVSQKIDPLENWIVCQTETPDGACSPTAGSTYQEHGILPQSVPDIMQSLQVRSVTLWLKIYSVVDEQDCKVK